MITLVNSCKVCGAVFESRSCLCNSCIAEFVKVCRASFQNDCRFCPVAVFDCPRKNSLPFYGLFLTLLVCLIDRVKSFFVSYPGNDSKT
jgi:hypothetical protein